MCIGHKHNLKTVFNKNALVQLATSIRLDTLPAKTCLCILHRHTRETHFRRFARAFATSTCLEHSQTQTCLCIHHKHMRDVPCYAELRGEAPRTSILICQHIKTLLTLGRQTAQLERSSTVRRSNSHLTHQNSQGGYTHEQRHLSDSVTMLQSAKGRVILFEEAH